MKRDISSPAFTGPFRPSQTGGTLQSYFEHSEVNLNQTLATSRVPLKKIGKSDAMKSKQTNETVLPKLNENGNRPILPNE